MIAKETGHYEHVCSYSGWNAKGQNIQLALSTTKNYHTD